MLAFPLYFEYICLFFKGAALRLWASIQPFAEASSSDLKCLHFFRISIHSALLKKVILSFGPQSGHLPENRLLPQRVALPIYFYTFGSLRGLILSHESVASSDNFRGVVLGMFLLF